jgi:hypothetical protein
MGCSTTTARNYLVADTHGKTALHWQGKANAEESGDHFPIDQSPEWATLKLKSKNNGAHYAK